MESRDLQQIEKFLDQVGKDSLFAYYKVQQDASDEELEGVLRKRRGWAQGQQANPKYRTEAMWLIKNNGLIRRALLEDRPAYTESARARLAAGRLDSLTPFIQGILAAGPLTVDGERAIIVKGEAMGLSPEAVREHLGTLSGGAVPATRPQAAPPDDFVDYYDLLQVSPAVSFDALESAHRARYRWARNLANKQESGRYYDLLDKAWRALEDPEKRKAYDALRASRPGADKPALPESAAEVPASASRISLGAPRRDTADTADTAGPPTPPDGIGGKTLGLSNKKPVGRRPRLAIASPELVQVKAGRQAMTHRIIIKNTGKGRMPGRISSDRKWLEISHSRLDPDAGEQEIEVVIQPARMPRRRAIALVSIITDHGERRAITFRVERRSMLVPMLGLVALVLAILLFTQLSTHLGGAAP